MSGNQRFVIAAVATLLFIAAAAYLVGLQSLEWSPTRAALSVAAA